MPKFLKDEADKILIGSDKSDELQVHNLENNELYESRGMAFMKRNNAYTYI